MKTPEDEAFDELERRQGGFQAKRAMAAAKLQEPVTEREALKLALEALKIWEQMYPKSSASCYRTPAITAIKEALAHPAQEPVALVIDGVLVKSALPEKYTGHLYTAPSQRTWVGLTEEERQDIALEVPMDAVLITEAKLKEKNA